MKSSIQTLAACSSSTTEQSPVENSDQDINLGTETPVSPLGKDRTEKIPADSVGPPLDSSDTDESKNVLPDSESIDDSLFE